MEHIDAKPLSQLVADAPERRLQEKQAKILVKQILEALSYLHANGVIHRDIKMENVLVDKQEKDKLIDFGFSVKASENK